MCVLLEHISYSNKTTKQTHCVVQCLLCLHVSPVYVLVWSVPLTSGGGILNTLTLGD